MFDQLNVFTQQNTTPWSQFQTVTADAASTNILDLDVAGISAVNPSIGPYLIVKVGAAFTGSMVSMEILLETDSDSAFATTKKQLGMWRFTKAQMTIGKLVVNQMLPIWDFQRYIRLYFVTWTDPTLGTIFGGLADGPMTAETDLDMVQAGS